MRRFVHILISLVYAILSTYDFPQEVIRWYTYMFRRVLLECLSTRRLGLVRCWAMSKKNGEFDMRSGMGFLELVRRVWWTYSARRFVRCPCFPRLSSGTTRRE
jgi:hypothetical protein